MLVLDNQLLLESAQIHPDGHGLNIETCDNSSLDFKAPGVNDETEEEEHTHHTEKKIGCEFKI